jgi:hypothetical protein
VSNSRWSESAIIPITTSNGIGYRPLDPASSHLDAEGARVCPFLERHYVTLPSASGPPDDLVREIARLKAEAAWWRHLFERYVPGTTRDNLAKAGTMPIEATFVRWEHGRIVEMKPGRDARRAMQTQRGRDEKTKLAGEKADRLRQAVLKLRKDHGTRGAGSQRAIAKRLRARRDAVREILKGSA